MSKNPVKTTDASPEPPEVLGVDIVYPAQVGGPDQKEILGHSVSKDQRLFRVLRQIVSKCQKCQDSKGMFGSDAVAKHLRLRLEQKK